RHDPGRCIRAKCPLDEINIVYTEVGDLSSAVIVKPAESVECAVLVIGTLGSWSEPCLPVQISRGTFVRWIANAVRPFVLDMKSPRRSNFSQTTVPHERSGFLTQSDGPPVDAHLADPVMLTNRFDYLTPLCHTKRQRFLDVNIFSRLASVHGLQSVP